MVCECTGSDGAISLGWRKLIVGAGLFPVGEKCISAGTLGPAAQDVSCST